MNKRILLAAVPVLALAATAAGWTYYRGTPQYSLKQAAIAVRHHDREAFQKYVAVDSIATGAADELMDRAMEEARKEAQGQEGFGALGAELAGTFIEGLKPMLAAGMRDAILKGVEKGDLRQGFALGDSTEGPSAALAESGVQHVELAGFNVVSRDGDRAVAELRLRRPDLGETFPLRLRLARRDGYWQVMRAEELVKFGERVEAVENRRLAEVNRPVLARLAGHVRLEGLRGSYENNAWDFEESVRFSARLTNVGREPLSLVSVEAGEGDGRAVMIANVAVVQPGQTVEVASTSYRYSPANPLHAQVGRRQDVALDAPMRLAQAAIGGRTLRAYSEWAQYRDAATK